MALDAPAVLLFAHNTSLQFSDLPIDFYELLVALGAPAGAFCSAKNTPLDLGEHAMSGYGHI